MVKIVADELIEKNLLSQSDLMHAEQELKEIEDTDTAFQRLWIVTGVK